MAPPFVDPPLLDNRGQGPLAVPGFGSLPVEIELQPEDRFTRSKSEWYQEQNLTARELAMLALMDEMTDKATWVKDVLDDVEVAKLREQALEKELISEKAWAWCLAELHKAVVYRKTGCVLVYNTGAGICKCDIKNDLTTNMREDVASLIDSIPGTKGSRGDSDPLLRNLVNPRLYPLVYGRSIILLGAEIVELDNLFKHKSTGRIAQEPSKQGPFIAYSATTFTSPTWYSRTTRGPAWSTQFQALPCEVQFSESIGPNVRITSYINNLHPEFKRLYDSIEKLVALSIGPWNEVLIRENRGRTPLRIKTYAVSPRPPEPDVERYTEAGKFPGTDMYLSAIEQVKAYCDLPEEPPSPPSEGEIMRAVSPFDVPSDLDRWCKEGIGLGMLMKQKWRRGLRAEHPEPGVSFTYEQWKAGQGGEAISRKRVKGPNAWSYTAKETADPDHQFYEVALEEFFRQKGLQVVVKISTVELGIDHPRFPGTDWHVEGLGN